MATILLTWELGANAGHVHPLGAIASELKKRGHDVLVSVKDIAAGEKYLASLGIDIIQAPIWNGHINLRNHSAINYAELLMLSGYLDVDQVAGQIRSWMNLITLLKPSMVLANHSPSVLLAARILGIRAAQFGTGFDLPPDLPGMPSMQPWAKFPQERLISSERRILEVINEALYRCGEKPLTSLSDMFDISRYFNTLPETDHYGIREYIKYWGLIQSSQNTIEPDWPALEGPRVYVYMRSDSRPYKALINSLKHLDWPVLVVSRGITDKEIKSFTANNINFSSELVNLDSVARQANLVVTNCNHGTTVELLQRGCKLLVMPLQVEQAMLAHRLSSQGLVISAAPNLPDYCELIEKVHSSTELKNNVDKFYKNYGNMDSKQQLADLVDDIESKLADIHQE